MGERVLGRVWDESFNFMDANSFFASFKLSRSVPFRYGETRGRGGGEGDRLGGFWKSNEVFRVGSINGCSRYSFTRARAQQNILCVDLGGRRVQVLMETR